MTNTGISIDQYEQLVRKLDEYKKTEEELRRTKNILSEAQRIAHIGNWVWDIVNNTLEWSDEIYHIFGLKPQEFGATYQAFLSSVHPDDREFVENSVNNALYKNQPYSIDHRIILPNGRIKIVHEQAEIKFDEGGKPTQMLGTVQDITENVKAQDAKEIEEQRIRASLVLNQMKDISEEAIVNYALEESVKLTKSKFGYLHFINEDQRSLSLHTWSKEVLKTCTAAKTPHYPIEQGGVWVDCVKTKKPAIHNDYQNLPHKKGYPDGHVHVTRHMSVPIIDYEKVVAIIGVGNKIDPYNQADAQQIAQLISFMWEILKRKRAELHLKEERDRVQNYLDIAAVMLLVLNRNQKIALINKKGCEILEAKEEEIIGQNWFDIFLPEEIRDDVKIVFDKLMNGIIEPTEFYENPIITKKGNKKMISWHNTVLRDDEENIIAVLSSGEDITARKLAEEELKKYQNRLEELVLERTMKLENANKQLQQEIKDRIKAEEEIKKSEERYRQLFENSPIALKEEDLSEVKTFFDNLRQKGIKNFKEYFENNPQDVKKCASLVKTLNINQGYLDLYKGENKEQFQLGLQNIFTEESYDAFRDELIALAEGKTFFETEAITQTFQGSKINIIFRLSVHPDFEKTLSRVLISVLDMTERIEFENLRRQFVYTVSHELRTPISVINQSIFNLQKYQEKLNDAQKVRLRSSLARNAEILSELVEDLLLVSRLDREKITLNWTPYNLSEVLQDVLIQLESQLNAKEMSVQCEINESIQLLGDPMRIAQILRIFIDNAIKYSHERGKIIVKIIDHYHGQYNSSAIDGVLIQVIDEGRGIREEDIPNLFQKFFRSTDVTGIPGTGLGLSIAQDLVRLHQGETYVESTHGVGTTFFVFLPRLNGPPNNE